MVCGMISKVLHSHMKQILLHVHLLPFRLRVFREAVASSARWSLTLSDGLVYFSNLHGVSV